MAKSWGSRSIELFEHLEQVGEGTVRRQRKESFSTLFPPPVSCSPTLQPRAIRLTVWASLSGYEQANRRNRGFEAGEDGQ